MESECKESCKHACMLEQTRRDDVRTNCDMLVLYVLVGAIGTS